jgi:ribose-phosphate pyrophosphokinase
LSEKLVLAGPASRDLASSVAEQLGTELIESEFKIFPDGESKLTLSGDVAGKTVVVVQSTYAPVDQHLFQLMLASHHLSQEGAKVIAAAPYLAYARQDKEFLPGEVVTLGVVAHLLRSTGVRRLATVDIHSAEGLSLFSFPAYSVSAIPMLVQHVSESMKPVDPVVISPDFGGSKRTEAFAQLYGAPLLKLAKTRDRESGAVRVEQQKLEVKGKDVVIVDDIISTAGTVTAAAGAVLDQGARSVSAVCVHGLFVGDALKRMEQAGVKAVVSTNTVPGPKAQVDVSGALVSHLRTVEE